MSPSESKTFYIAFHGEESIRNPAPRNGEHSGEL
jgi:hypothetical protein